MNDQVSDEAQPYHHQQQQQHGYPPMHQQQQPHPQLANQQHMFTPPPHLIPNQTHLAHHHHHPLVQTQMRLQYHHMTTPPVSSHNPQTWVGGTTSGSSQEQTQQQPTQQDPRTTPPVLNSHSPQTWGGGTTSGSSQEQQQQQPTQQQPQQTQQPQQQQQQPPQHQPSSGHYNRDADHLYKGATEHLFSAVQQQLESLRDHESEEIQEATTQRPANLSVHSVDSPLASPPQSVPDSSSNASQVANKDPTESGDGLLTVQVRITEANRELQVQKDPNRPAEARTNDNAISNNSAESQQSSAGSASEHLRLQVESQQSSIGSASEHLRLDQTNSERQGGVIHANNSERDHLAKDTHNSDDGQLNTTTNAACSSANSSSSSTTLTPLLPPTTGSKEAAHSQHEKTLDSQTSSQTVNEKGVVWQTLVIGGKSVRYKVLGNVKMRKAAVVPNKMTPGQVSKDKDSNPQVQAKNKQNHPGTEMQGDPETAATAKTGQLPRLISAKRLKVVKIFPPGTDLSKIGRPPGRSPGKPSRKSSECETSPLQGDKEKTSPTQSRSGRPRKYKRPMKYDYDGPIKTSQITQKSQSGNAKASSTDESNAQSIEASSDMLEDSRTTPTAKQAKDGQTSSNGIESGNSLNDNTRTEDSRPVDLSIAGNGSIDSVIGNIKKRKLLGDLPGKKKSSDDLPGKTKPSDDLLGKRRSPRKRKPVLKEPLILDEEDLYEEELTETSQESYNQTEEFTVTTSKKKIKRQKDSRSTRWSNQEIRALSGFLVSAKKAGVYKKEWPTMRDNDTFWNRAADCCNVVRLDKKKRSGAACAHWTFCYLKPNFITTSQMSFHFKSQGSNVSPDQYQTCKCYKPPTNKKSAKKSSKEKSKHFSTQLSRDRGCQASALCFNMETQTVVSTVSVSNGLKEFVSMLSADDALEVADMALHYALKEQTIYNVAGNFLELCVAAFKVLQKYRQANVIEEFARVLAISRDDGLPRMQPDKMPFAMIAYNIRYFNNSSPFGLTVPPPYAEWLHSMYNIFGQRFHELFEGPTPDHMDIADRHPYRSVLLNVATVSRNYLKRQTDEKDKAEAENPPEPTEANQEATKKKQLMNKQGKSIRELMTDVAIPPLARRKLQQAFAIIQRASNLTTPDNEPTCEHCGASIPKPPKPPKKYMRKKRKRITDHPIRLKNDAKKRRSEALKLGPTNLAVPVHLARALRKGNDEQSTNQDLFETSAARRKTSEPQRRPDPFPRNLAYHSPPGVSQLERMIINAPGMAPPRELPPSLQEDWASGRPQHIPTTPAAVAVRGVYPTHGTVDIMWQPGQPTTGWQHEDVRNQVATQQQQQHAHQHGQRTSMVPSTSSAPVGVQHIGQPQVTHTYY